MERNHIMSRGFIYTDICCPEMEQKIITELDLYVVRTFDVDNWSINNAMLVIPEPNLILGVINQIDYISLMEIALLDFMCKKILITTKAINEYPILNRVISYIDTSCYLGSIDSQFTSWFKLYKKEL